jgi:tetratricopeptide (TPR) repeat protein
VAVLTLLGEAALRSGDVATAVERYSRALALARAQARPEAPALMASLAAAELAGGDPGTGLDLARAALDQLDGAAPLQSLFAAEVRAVALDRLGRPLEAAQAFDRVAAERAGLQGADHPTTLFAEFNAASALFEAGRLHTALTRREALLDRAIVVFGPAHPLTALAWENAAESRWAAGQDEMAGEAHARAVSIYAALPGAGGTAGLRARADYGLHLLRGGRPHDALHQLRPVLQIAPRGFGDAAEIDRREAARRLVEAAYGAAGGS